jgi:hypothetical protein
LRPKKNFKNLQSAEYSYRQSIKERFDFKCCVCGTDMKDVVINHQVVANDKLWCRKCYGKSKQYIEFKPRSKETIEQVMSETGSLDEVCSILKIGRSALYKKRKRLGLLMLRVRDRVLTKEMVDEALTNNRTLGEAAKSLGINRKDLYVKRKEFGLPESKGGRKRTELTGKIIHICHICGKKGRNVQHEDVEGKRKIHFCDECFEPT